MTVEKAARDIETMKVRGAAEIARHAARALAAEAEAQADGSVPALRRRLAAASRRLLSTRPTAVSLRNAIDLVMAAAASPSPTPRALSRRVAAEAARFERESLAARSAMARHGVRLLGKASVCLTHCNSQAALQVLVEGRRRGRVARALATESRPWFQGHLTVRQLAKARVPVALLIDSAVASVMPEVDAVVVGADSIAQNGDVVNKIGTRQVAIVAREQGVPVYVCAETFKLDRRARTGADVAIEERDVAEVGGPRAIPGVRVLNPVFDATPARLIRRIVTERGAVAPRRIADLVDRRLQRRVP
ncbi:MAG: S-methyl-5-thioribose-1-phosphate isomerase [Methanobacteriota archaeon]